MIAHGCEKLAQGFYTAAIWTGVEPRICDMLVRRSTSNGYLCNCQSGRKQQFADGIRSESSRQHADTPACS